MAVTASNCSDLALPKPEPRRKAKARAKRGRAAWIADIRRQVWQRSRGFCEWCPTWLGVHSGHLHEKVFRSRLRGRPVEEIVNLENCVRLCPDCHSEAHGLKVVRR